MTMTNRKTIRHDLVAKLKTITLLADEAGGTAHVVGYWPKDPQGISPFVGVDSGSVQYPTETDESNMTPFAFAVGVWVRRDAAEAAAEDTLDDLALEIAEVIRNNYNGRFVAESVTDQETIGGIPYKFEVHFVVIDG
jgi:hypothetical protein